MNLVVRMVRSGDVDALLALAQHTGPGLTSFKPDAAALAARVERVARTVAGEAPLASQGYLFVLEDMARAAVVGVSGIETAVGLGEPFYNYRVGTVVHASRELQVWSRMRVLTISNDLTGSAELCSLFLHPDYRQHGAGALLSKARFLFMARFADRFPTRLCAEMRGHFDQDGESPFWQALGARFYQIDFSAADYLSSHGKKSFVAELMPRYPVYVELLDPAARECIGQTHRDTQAARHMLESEGMRYESHVDIFDAGPVLEAHRDATRAARESFAVRLEIDAGPPSTDAANGPSPEPYLVAAGDIARFRSVLVPRGPRRGILRITAAEADALQVRHADPARVYPLHPPRRRGSG